MLRRGGRGMTKAIIRSRAMTSVIDTLKPGRLWRIRRSGVSERPANAPLTGQIIDGLSSVGIEVVQKSSGSPANADSYTVSARFLDGGIDGETRTYIGPPRGVYIDGPRALVFISVLLGRTLPASLLTQLRSVDPGIDAHFESCRGQVPGPLGIPLQCGYPVFPKTEISEYTLRAYVETRYEAQTECVEPITLSIGEFNARLLSCYRSFGVESSVFLTAYNPFSGQLSSVENEKRHRNLLKHLQGGRTVLFEGRGYHPSGVWEEKSVLAFGTSLASARYLGKTFEQNAVVWTGADAVPRLILLR